MDYGITAATWFWLLVPMPLLVVWAIWGFLKERRDSK